MSDAPLNPPRPLPPRGPEPHLPPQPQFQQQPPAQFQPQPPAPAEPEDSSLGTKLWLVRAAKALVGLIYLMVVIELVLLALGFALRLFGASTDASFTRWVYRNVDRAMEPFRGMFPTRAVTDQSVFDTSLLFAMIVYAIVGIALHALVAWLTDKVVHLQRDQERAEWRRRQAAARPQVAP